jgi:shikimate dehydrogenase
MHNAAFGALGLDYVYVAWRVGEETLADAVHGIRALGVAGFNVTVPHKVAILPLLDGLDDEARRIGAVNTVLVDGGRLIGYNTDAEGFLGALRDSGCDPAGSRSVIYGAGGAARSVAFALARAGVGRMDLVNRSADKAAALAREVIADGATFHLGAVGLDDVTTSELTRQADLVINATSLGLGGVGMPVSPDNLRPGQYVMDLVYNPVTTPFLAAAASKGCRVITGDAMLLYQGARAFTLWTGEAAPLDAMRTALAGGLGR